MKISDLTTQMARVNNNKTEKQAKVSRVLTFSCVDGPGNRLVLFLQGCNFDCITCHNPHTINHCNHCGDCVSGCPSGALSTISGKVIWDPVACTNCDQCIDVCGHKSSPKITTMTVSEVLELVRHNQFFLSGITVSGGEATMQLPFIIDLFEAMKSDLQLAHLTCFIDSNGSLSKQGWEKVLPFLDGAMIDLKSWQSETHNWLVGRGNHRVFETINYLAEQGKLHEVRLLHIPGKSDLEDEIEQVGYYLKGLPADVRIRLNAFQHHGVTGEALEWPKCTKQQMQSFHDQLYTIVQRPMQTPEMYT
ncbi:putative glycyl-radical enzyme activating enzyme YjjW [Vibrio chagasii]|uniref:YjjW family glycine radical enzyme activase n=1 Tax=Vibrio chagasii TaxID=170679 RepID=UPI001EFDD8A7|nr:YjjW family glycine radical enzyme activase [Vibrio chagasii]MCG9605771.1 YjjW family glycine radical enzyme activase [Vibrio chagasii]CAH6999742.1 putative glycyl-radical enzyme activating enzyme YjjW [Vibrio chagasii]CAH7090028.1 putative glycyl-radical enzyme activating enzyme YjjW [Vibrio chagasii]CAH7093097.1 putative glycyl-radical enzyme activating enzyme YjjW [Vibrio chagasii]CAH7471951.1 putative glycyl-radical enzyme activating enzyme YjjW [Vibrio chagasii]